MKFQKDFNIVICGTGGQGIITLQKIIVEAAALSGFDVKSSELHGLSQRGGSVESHIRFGKKIFSPLVRQGGADLILALEPQEALKSCYYGSREIGTKFLINTTFSPIPLQKSPSLQYIEKNLKKFAKEVFFIDATQKVLAETGSPVTAGTCMLGFAAHNNLLPINPQILLEAIKNSVKPEYFALNKKVFEAEVKVLASAGDLAKF